MLQTCNQCHSRNFAKAELEKGDEMIRQADRLMAEAIEVIAALYKDSVLPKPKNYAYAYPDLLTFHDAPTPIEQKLFVIEWTANGANYGNHYLLGTPPFSLERYRQWLRRIASLPMGFEAQEVGK